MRSMTAYGKAAVDTPFGKWIVEISSVNRKGLEVVTSLSHQMLKEEFAMRKWLSPHVQRGYVTVRANLQSPPEALVDANLPRLRKVKKAWDQIALELGYPPSAAIDIRFLIEQLAEAHVEASPEVVEGLEDAFGKAVKEWVGMRETEGKMLCEDIEKHLNILEVKLKQTEALLPRAIEELRSRLKMRLEEVSQDVQANEERIMREVVLMAEKWDVNEEIARIKAHVMQCKFSMEREKGAIGKALDFLVQELHREINTLGAKINDLAVVRIVLEMKGEVEKIREQVQNVE